MSFSRVCVCCDEPSLLISLPVSVSVPVSVAMAEVEVDSFGIGDTDRDPEAVSESDSSLLFDGIDGIIDELVAAANL